MTINNLRNNEGRIVDSQIMVECPNGHKTICKVGHISVDWTGCCSNNDDVRCYCPTPPMLLTWHCDHCDETAPETYEAKV